MVVLYNKKNLLSFCHVETLWELSIFQSSFGRRFLPHTHSPQRETSRRGSVPPGGLHRGLRAVHGVPDRNIRFGSTGPKNWAGLHQGVGGYPPSLRRSSVSPRGVPGPRVGTPGGTPLPPGGRGGCRPEFCLTTGRGGTPGGYPGGVSGTPKRGVPGGVQKCTKYLPKKRKLIVRLFGRTFGAKRGFRTPPDFPENSAQFSCLKFGARILH